MIDDIVTFIRARLDEDERFANELHAHHPEPWQIREPEPGGGLPTGRWVDDAADEGVAVANGSYMARHVQRHGPARVLRAVYAKRRVVNLHAVAADDEVSSRARFAERSLKLLAAEWSDHADYRSKWAE